MNICKIVLKSMIIDGLMHGVQCVYPALIAMAAAMVFLMLKLVVLQLLFFIAR